MPGPRSQSPAGLQLPPNGQQVQQPTQPAAQHAAASDPSQALSHQSSVAPAATSTTAAANAAADASSYDTLNYWPNLAPWTGRPWHKFTASTHGNCRTSGVSEESSVNIHGSKQSKNHQRISQRSESVNRHRYDKRPFYFQAMERTKGRNAVFGITRNHCSDR